MVVIDYYLHTFKCIVLSTYNASPFFFFLTNQETSHALRSSCHICEDFADNPQEAPYSFFTN